MTDIQDVLLDKLVGSSVGSRWKDGPFQVAAELLAGKPIRFTGRYEDTTAKNAIAGRLGYPLALLAAAHGALSVLELEDDRRSLAMTLIRLVTPGSKQKPRPRGVYLLAAVSVAHRAHALVCGDPKCGVTAILSRALSADSEEGRDKALAPFFKKKCATYGKSLDRKISISQRTAAIDRTVAAAQSCVGVSIAASGSEMHQDVNRAARDAGGAAGQAGGVEAAVELCIHLAQRLGLEVGW